MLTHADYPHTPGYLHDCVACEARCHCTPDLAECVWAGHEYLTVAEAAAFMGVDVSRVRSLIRNGSLVGYSFGNRVMVHAAQVSDLA